MYRSIQASRAVAAILVVLFHLGGIIALDKYFGTPEFDFLFAAGDAGVEFFFVLSGFIIFTAHRADVGTPNRLGYFLKKRFARIFPTYWIVFIAVYLAAIAAPSLRNTVPHDPGVLLKSLALLPQNPLEAGGTGAPVLFVAWTLQYEMFFYAFFALLILSRRAAVLGAACLGALYLSCAATASCGAFPLSFFSSDYVLLFGFGMAVAVLANRHRMDGPLFFVLTGVVFFVLVSADKVFHIDLLGNWKIIFFGLASSMIVFGLVTAENAGRVLGGHRLAQLLGECSYALYLIHVPVISLMYKIFVLLHFKDLGIAGAAMAYVFTFACCIGAAILVHVWIEKPVSLYFRSRKSISVLSLATK
jgi:exopolysaccharide production protein ExoZ